MLAIGTNGIQIPDHQSVVQQLIDGFRKIYGSDIVLTADSPDGQRLALFAEMCTGIMQATVRALNDMNPNNATGSALDIIAILRGLARTAGAPTTATFTLNFNKATTLKSNFEIIDANNVSWILPSDLDVANPGQVDVLFHSSNVGGFIPTPPFKQAVIDDAIANILMKTVVTSGTAIETDNDLRGRILATTSQNTSTQGRDILLMQDAISQLKSNNTLMFSHIRFYVNEEDQPDPKTHIPAHSICLVASVNPDITQYYNSQAEAISDAMHKAAEIILRYKSAGIGTFGSYSVTFNVITDILGTQVPVDTVIKIEEATSVPFRIEFDITGTPPPDDEIKSYLVANIKKSISETITATDILVLLFQFLAGKASASNVQIANEHGNFSDDLSQPPDWNEFLTLSESDIAITHI